jgi:hypothetical protein
MVRQYLQGVLQSIIQPVNRVIQFYRMELLIRHFNWYRPKRFSGRSKSTADGKIIVAGSFIVLMACCVIKS